MNVDEVISQGNNSKPVEKKCGQLLNPNSNVLTVPTVNEVAQQPNQVDLSQPVVRRTSRVTRQPDRLIYK